MKNLIIAVLLILSAFAYASELQFSSPHTFYADKDIILNIKSDGLSGKSLSWNLKYAGHTIAAGEQQIPENEITEVKFHFPELKPGVIATTEFSCFSGDTKFLSELFFYTPNPFADNKKFLEELKIELWAPENDENAKKLLESLQVPFSMIANFAESKGKVLIVSSIDFGNFSGLSDDFSRICATGTRILIINPTAGSLPLKMKDFKEIVVARNAKITDFYKNFDSELWGNSFPNDKSFKLIPYDNGIAIEIQKERGDFTYLSAKIADGELILCAWDIFGKSDKSPTPVYLLEKLTTKTLRHQDK